jgi:hypothetical protein
VRLSMSKRLVTKIFRPFRYPYPAFSSGTIAGILVSGLAGSFILVSRLVGIGRGSPSSSRDIVGDDVLSLYLICDPGRSELESGWQGHLIFLSADVLVRLFIPTTIDTIPIAIELQYHER